jgi:hypothetical protein
MRPARAPQYTAPSDSALVVFVRDSRTAARVDFPIVDERRRFVGNVRGDQHAIAEVRPGQHTFYVLSEQAEPVRARLRAGRTYFVLLKPARGGARVALQIVPRARALELQRDLARTTPLVPELEVGTAWVKEHRLNVEYGISDAERAWDEGDAAWRAERTLRPQDGLLAGQLTR